MDRAAFLRYQAAIQRAEDAYARGAYAEAFDLHIGLLKERLGATLEADAALENAGDILVTDRLAQLALLFGHAEAADALLDACAGVARDAGNLYLCDYATLQRVQLALAAGRQRAARNLLGAMAPRVGRLEAIAFTEAGLAAWEREHGWSSMGPAARHVLLGSFYLACGRLFAALGRYHEALAALERGVQHCGGDAPDLARRLDIPLGLAQAMCRVEQGDLVPARERADAIAAAIEARRQPAWRVQMLELRARLALLAGDFGTALARLQEVLAMARRAGLHGAAMAAAINLAHVMTVLNQTAAAAELLESARAAALSRDEQGAAMRIAVLLRLGALRGQSLAEETAIAPSVREWWEGPAVPDPAPPVDEFADPELLPQEGGFLAFFETRALIVHWHLGQQHFGCAREALAVLERTFGNGESRLIALRLDVLRAMLDYHTGSWDAAATRLDTARAVAQALGLSGELRQILRYLTMARARLGAPAATLRALAEEADRLLQAQSATLGGAERALYLLNKWTADEEMLALEVHRLQALKRAAGAAAWPRRLALQWRIRAGLQRLAGRIDRHKALVAARVLDEAQPLPPARLQRWTGWRSATLTFLVLPDRTVTIRACGLALDFGVTALTRLHLRELVGQWHTERAGGEPLSEALALDRVLAGLPARVSALRIVADDVLHGVPFAALRYQGKYWIERYALSMDLETIPAARPGTATPYAPPLVGGVSRAAGVFPPLPGVVQELAAVSAALASPTPPLLNADLTRAVLVARLPAASLAHIACHGVFAPDRPDQSGLVLIPQPGKVEMVSLRDLARLDLRSVEHLTLSSCWGADSFVAPGRWVISLPQTLVRAGADSVLASLWLVDDASAVAFMTRFYAALRTRPRDRALQSAQLACLAQGGAAADPWAWSGFILVGQAGPLRTWAARHPAPAQGASA